MTRQLLLLLSLLLLPFSLSAENWDDIIKSGKYYYGEATAETLAEAERMAMASMVSMIATSVSSEFSELDLSAHRGSQEEHESLVRSCVRTYAQSSLTNVQKWQPQGKEPHITARCYMLRTELERIYGNRTDKAKSMVGIANQALEKRKIDIALQYYYWAYSLIRSLQRPTEVTDDEGNQLVTWLPARINAVLSDISVAYEKREGDCIDLLFNYKGQPVSSLEFTYSDGRSDCPGSAKDGRGMIEMVPGFQASAYHLSIEYEFKLQATGDAEMQSVLDVIVRKPFTRADVNVKGEVAGNQTTKRPNDQLPKPTPNPQPNDPTGVHLKPSKSQVVANDAAYAAIVAKVADAIQKRRYSDVYAYFTVDGLEMFNKLIAYGTGRIVGTPNVKFFKSIDGGVVARGMQMSFTFRGKLKKSIVEDVTFTFDSQQKIDGVAFGLGHIAENDILCKEAPGLNDYSREMIMEFLENYKTAYCLQRLDYIREIFADDAVIIVGKVTKRPTARQPEQKMSLEGQNIISYNRFTKDEYLKHLARNFRRNEFINIRFTNNDVQWLEKFKDQKVFAIQIGQEYTSSTYGDKGYLFLLVNMNNPEQPQIKIRTWQPNEVSMDSLYHAGYFFDN